MSKSFKYYKSYQEENSIYNIVEAAKNFGGLTDANRYLSALCDSEPTFIQLSHNVYQYKDYYINVKKRFLMAGHGQCLMNLARLELSCLPPGHCADMAGQRRGYGADHKDTG